jgi:hypothetical protein
LAGAFLAGAVGVFVTDSLFLTGVFFAGAFVAGASAEAFTVVRAPEAAAATWTSTGCLRDELDDTNYLS